MNDALPGAGLVAMDPQLFITATFVGLVIVLAIVVALIVVVGSRREDPRGP